MFQNILFFQICSIIGLLVMCLILFVTLIPRVRYYGDFENPAAGPITQVIMFIIILGLIPGAF